MRRQGGGGCATATSHFGDAECVFGRARQVLPGPPARGQRALPLGNDSPGGIASATRATTIPAASLSLIGMLVACTRVCWTR